MGKQAKQYRAYWLTDEGETYNLEYVTTDKPQNALFNIICGMLATSANIFDAAGKPGNIRKWIQAGTSNREHYFAEINGQVLGVMETK